MEPTLPEKQPNGSQTRLAKAINTLDRQIEVIENQRKVKLVRLQEQCLHPIEHIREGDVEKLPFSGKYLPPFRVCTLCGLAEEGWHCGYDKLGRFEDGVIELPRDEAMKFVLTFLTQDQMHHHRVPKKEKVAVRT